VKVVSCNQWQIIPPCDGNKFFIYKTLLFEAVVLQLEVKMVLAEEFGVVERFFFCGLRLSG
jgi:hypothetical protein